MRILVLNGPNLNLLGTREPSVYGSLSLQELMDELAATHAKVSIDHFQSNHEGELIDRIQDSDRRYAGVILNAGGYTHTSVAIRDAVAAISIPVVEVHISNVFAREDFRHVSLIGAVCAGSISGFGLLSYRLAVEAIIGLHHQK